MINVLLSLLFFSAAAGDDTKLEILDVRGTYGYLGARRPVGTGISPGEVLHFSFDIKNLKLDAGGRASYSIAVEVFDDKGHVIFHLKPQNGVAYNYFGGTLLPCSSFLEIPPDTKPGSVSWKITVADRAAGKTAVSEGKGKILPLDFGLIQVGTFADREARVAVAPVGVVGGNLYINFAAVGFARDPKTKQPDLEVTLRVLDAAGKPTFANPLRGEVNSDLPENVKIVPLQFGLTMNRVGQFTVELVGRCRLCNKSTTVTFPIRILANE